MITPSGNAGLRARFVPTLERASGWDILFLLGEISAGAEQRHFSASLATAREQMSLALRCCKAILARRSPFVRQAGTEFVVARQGSATIGAALASTELDARGDAITTIEYVVVDARFRGTGAGAALVRHFLHPARCVQVWCTPWSTTMHKLLRKLGFKRLQKTQLAQDGAARAVMPALWQWKEEIDTPEPVRRKSHAPAALQR